MARPEISIDVDEATGRWRVDALPMILVPQHFFNNNHFAIEAAIGTERYREILHSAGYRSAHHWCMREATHHGLSGLAVFEHYMRRLSQRGWGQFSIEEANLAEADFTIRVAHSAFVDDERKQAGRKLCWMFEAWLEGSLSYVLEEAGRPVALQARETQCAAEGFPCCTFKVLAAR